MYPRKQSMHSHLSKVKYLNIKLCSFFPEDDMQLNVHTYRPYSV